MMLTTDLPTVMAADVSTLRDLACHVQDCEAPGNEAELAASAARAADVADLVCASALLLGRAAWQRGRDATQLGARRVQLIALTADIRMHGTELAEMAACPTPDGLDDDDVWNATDTSMRAIVDVCDQMCDMADRVLAAVRVLS